MQVKLLGINFVKKNLANFVPLTPVSFLHRSADVFGHRTALIYEDNELTWGALRERCVRMADALVGLGVAEGDTVAVLAFNTPEMFESHFSVPMAGAVLNTINTRLDAQTIAYILDDGNAKVFIVDAELTEVAEAALVKSANKPQVILINDAHANSKPTTNITAPDYESILSTGNANFEWVRPKDEWSPLSLNYTSGTTGKPKGVVYHHRGSYLMSMGTVIGWQLPNHPRYLYTVPMFHCNGWGHAWTMAAVAGTVICLRTFLPERVFKIIEKHDVTHFGGAPIMLNMLSNAPDEIKKSFNRTIHVMTAGAPPPATVLKNMMTLGFDIMHVYGLTETYGHILQAAPQLEWQSMTGDEQAQLRSRQGVRFPMTEDVSVIDQDNGAPVPFDGKTIGEIVVRGNTCMMGYLNSPSATDEAFSGGWFHSGDLAVVHADGYIQIKDRSKDIIISGGENISSVEIEDVLYKHPEVGEAAVVAMPDDHWGEVPCAFVELRPNSTITESILIQFCKEHMAKFKRPKKIIFGPLPKTATGKIQKHALRKVFLNQ
ncbi:MAG: long-chain-fatty-acid--CoA ligase [Gammaproteobacteria bacterium]|nr:long-chain-fatty-acid--CoA ligase [Gammaproteobacteria bacterium]